MLKPPWGLNAPHIRHSDQESGEDLQADVMRFMAILAFCLLAIFALVQNVPMNAQDQSMSQAHPVATVPREYRPPVKPQKKGTESSGKATPIHGMQDSKTTQLAHAQPQTTISKLMDITERDAEGHSQSVEDKSKASNDSLKSRQRHRLVPNRATSLADSPEQTTTTQQNPARHSAQAEQSAHNAKQFALRFESDFALESLVAQGKVQLFGQLGKRIWRLSIKGGNLRFHLTTPPRQFHTMTPESVPMRIATALRRDAAITHLGRITWGVTLPRVTTDQVMRYLRESSGGSLLIQPGGQVRLHEAN